MKAKVYEHHNGEDLELTTLIANSNKKLLGIIDIEAKEFNRLINCDKEKRNKRISEIINNLILN